MVPMEMNTLYNEVTWKPALNCTEYKQRIESASLFNSRLQADRKTRLPFFDIQTGVAQIHSTLFIAYRYRRPGKYLGQLYSYPEKRWKKRKRSEVVKEEPPVVDEDTATENGDVETGTQEHPEEHKIQQDQPVVVMEKIEIPIRLKNEEWETWDSDHSEVHKKDSSDDYESSYVKRRRKKSKLSSSSSTGVSLTGYRTPRSRSNRHAATAKKEERDDVSIDYSHEKPFGCETCGARYKTRPGLNYHLSHTHNRPELPISDDIPVCTVTSTTMGLKVKSTGDNTDSTKENKKPQPNTYCDFCLGLNSENKKTGTQEPLFSCADCGHSGHPSCLQFTENMIISVKQYAWQCIECKSCGLCGTSDNDEELLFCDDCDRGYHMYCLRPAITTPPDGSWSCHLCVKAFPKPEAASSSSATAVDDEK